VESYRVRFDPTTMPSDVAIYNDGQSTAGAWGIWKVTLTCDCEMLLLDNGGGGVSDVPAVVVGGRSSGMLNPPNVTMHVHAGVCAGTNSPTLPPADEDFCEVTVYTARARASSSSMGVKYAAFLVDGNWTAPVPFFTSANYGQQLSAKFTITALDGRDGISPTAVRLLYNATDSWSFWKVTMQCGCFQVLAENPIGNYGTQLPDPTFTAPTAPADDWQRWWMGGSGAEASVTSMDFPYDPSLCTAAPTLAPPSDSVCILRAVTSRARYASSYASGKFAEFMVNGKWTAPIHWFTHAGYGSVQEKEFDFGGKHPTQVKPALRVGVSA
jgi:hypothetical protein